jgi:hypothetical protein
MVAKMGIARNADRLALATVAQLALSGNMPVEGTGIPFGATGPASPGLSPVACELRIRIRSRSRVAQLSRKTALSTKSTDSCISISSPSTLCRQTEHVWPCHQVSNEGAAWFSMGI